MGRKSTFELSEANKNNAMFIKQSKYGGNNSIEGIM